jgi:hypothetical protein
MAMSDDRLNEGRLTTADLHNDVQPAGARVRLLHKPADYEDLEYLSEHEKDVAGKILLGYLESFGTEMAHGGTALLHDPELYTVTTHAFCSIKKLIIDTYLDKQVRGSVTDLMYVNIMKHQGCQQGMETYVENYVGRDTYDPRKTLLIDYPESDVFSPEERLAIKFSNAVLKNTMTDEIFAEAVERWGIKLTMRYIHFVGMYTMVTMSLNACGLTGAYNGNPAEYRHGYKSDKAFEKEVGNLETWAKEFEEQQG